MSKDYVRSPIFYMGNKLDLLNNIVPELPPVEDVDLFVDLFGGSGVVAANVPYKTVLYNELNPHIYDIFTMCKSVKPNDISDYMKQKVEEFQLEKANKHTYINFRTHYNNTPIVERDVRDLFLMTHFSFSNLYRFNQKGGFNMPVGNQQYNPDIHDKRYEKFYNVLKQKSIAITNSDAFDILKHLTTVDRSVEQTDFPEKTFIYLDPPYSNTTAVYNEQRAHGGWKIESDMEMFELLDKLTQKGYKWAMSNVFEHKGHTNTHLIEWSRKYNVIHFKDKQYTSLGRGNANSKEVLVKNY